MKINVHISAVVGLRKRTAARSANERYFPSACSNPIKPAARMGYSVLSKWRCTRPFLGTAYYWRRFATVSVRFIHPPLL